MRRYRVSGEEGGGAGARLDHFLVSRDRTLTRSQIRRLIEDGRARVGGRAVKAGHRLRAGDEVELEPPDPEPLELAAPPAQAIDLAVVFEDAEIVVVDKPPGLVVHPAPGHPDRTLVNALLSRAPEIGGAGGEGRPGIVHRLDKDTSGLLVAAKTPSAYAALVRDFSQKRVCRVYEAVVAPPPREAEGRFSTLYGRHPRARKKFSSRVSEGKPAVTRYRVRRRFGDLAALVSCELETGRTHQIRVHFADHGSPVLGDATYGRKRARPLAPLAAEIGRQALHAARLSLVHPARAESLTFEAPPPPDFEALLAALESAAA